MSQRPKKRTLKLPKEVIAKYRNRGKEETEVKAMISMFAEILCEKKNDNSARTEEGGTIGQWRIDCYDDGDEKCIQFRRNVGDVKDEEDMAEDKAEEEKDEEDDDQKQGTADEMAEQVAREEALEEEEKARKAAKRREKKLRKKEKLKEEATVKAEQTIAKKRSTKIQSWKSRVIAASQSNEGYKLRNLLVESPLDEDVDTHLEFLLPHCMPSQEEASRMLAAFIVNKSCKVVFAIGKNGRNALHTACLNADSYFVKLVVEQQVGGELDSLCHDSGWSPLHYAVASGSFDILEMLLAAGANVKTCTEDSLTCRASDEKGITAQELAQVILAGKQDDEIETQGGAFREALERYAGSVGFLDILRTMVERLKDVDTNGYTPLTMESTRPRSPSVSEEAATKPKKKNTKSANQLKQEKAKCSVASNAASIVEPVEQKEDPLVVALLGMGFTRDQIHAAAKACGGMERATADDMVMWILGGGEESSSPATRVESSSPKETASSGRNDKKIAQASVPAKNAATADLERAHRENIEAVKREQEARALAERLAAKKEEQRRRNREWNTRAQARQQEELERRAREEAQRRTQERVVAQRTVTQGAAALVGLTVDVSSKPAKAAAPKAPTKILQRPAQPSLKSGLSTEGILSNVAAPARQTRGAQSAGAGKGRSEFEPTSQYVSSGASVSSGGSGRQSAGGLKQTSNSMYGQRPSNVPPGFHNSGGFPIISGGSFNMDLNEGYASSYEESSAPGEIRATAKAFVPTGFTSTPATLGITASASASSAFPALGLPPVTQSSAFSNDNPLSSLLKAGAASEAGLPLGFERPATATPSVTQSPSTISSSVTGITATEEPSLNSVVGFELDGLVTRPSLLDALSSTPSSSGMESSHGMAGSSIWGSDSLAPGPGLSGFPGFDIGEAAPGQQTPARGRSGASQWSFSQGGTLNSIW